MATEIILSNFKGVSALSQPRVPRERKQNLDSHAEDRNLLPFQGVSPDGFELMKATRGVSKGNNANGTQNLKLTLQYKCLDPQSTGQIIFVHMPLTGSRGKTTNFAAFAELLASHLTAGGMSDEDAESKILSFASRPLPEGMEADTPDSEETLAEILELLMNNRKAYLQVKDDSYEGRYSSTFVKARTQAFIDATVSGGGTTTYPNSKEAVAWREEVRAKMADTPF